MSDSLDEEKLQAEINKLRAESFKLEAEASKMQAEREKILSEKKQILRYFWPRASWFAGIASILSPVILLYIAYQSRFFEGQSNILQARKERLDYEIEREKDKRDSLSRKNDSLIKIKDSLLNGNLLLLYKNHSLTLKTDVLSSIAKKMHDSAEYSRNIANFYKNKLIDTVKYLTIFRYDKKLSIGNQYMSSSQYLTTFINKHPLNYSNELPSVADNPKIPMFDSVYISENGKIFFQTGHNKSKKLFLIRTVRSTQEIFPGEEQSNSRGWVNPISYGEAELLKRQIMQGKADSNFEGLISLPNNDLQRVMMKVVSNDNGSGGTKSNNNRIYGGYIKGDTVISYLGTIANPALGAADLVVKEGEITFHSHPSGSKSIGNTLFRYSQGPSSSDIQSMLPYRLGYVFAMAERIVYIFNSTGIIGTLPFSAWGQIVAL